MRTLSQSVRKWRKIYLSPFIVPRRGLRAFCYSLCPVVGSDFNINIFNIQWNCFVKCVFREVSPQCSNYTSVTKVESHFSCLVYFVFTVLNCCVVSAIQSHSTCCKYEVGCPESISKHLFIPTNIHYSNKRYQLNFMNFYTYKHIQYALKHTCLKIK